MDKYNFSPQFIGHVITYPCRDLSQNMLINGAPGNSLLKSFVDNFSLLFQSSEAIQAHGKDFLFVLTLVHILWRVFWVVNMFLFGEGVILVVNMLLSFETAGVSWNIHIVGHF